MNHKIEITKYVAAQSGLCAEDINLRKLVAQWWQNPRKKNNGGLRLTDAGFARFSSYFKYHKVKFESPIEYTSQLVIQLDNFIDCPWYVTNRFIFVFSDKMAVQLVLFSGDIAKFSRARAKSADSA
jgi:hypothetical protein